MRLLVLFGNAYPAGAYECVNIAFWSCIEVNTAIVCSCVPTIRPLVSKMCPGLEEWQSDPTDDKPPADANFQTIGSKPLRRTFSFPDDDRVHPSWIFVPRRSSTLTPIYDEQMSLKRENGSYWASPFGSEKGSSDAQSIPPLTPLTPTYGREPNDRDAFI
jgi:hypothetical protein